LGRGRGVMELEDVLPHLWPEIQKGVTIRSDDQADWEMVTQIKLGRTFETFKGKRKGISKGNQPDRLSCVGLYQAKSLRR